MGTITQNDNTPRERDDPNRLIRAFGWSECLGCGKMTPTPELEENKKYSTTGFKHKCNSCEKRGSDEIDDYLQSRA